MKKWVTLFLKTVLPLLLGIYLIAFFFTSMSEESKNQFYFALKKANYLWIFVSLVLGWIALVSRAQRWKYVLEPLGHKTPLKNRYHAITIGYLINLTIPRAGEASRAVMLYRSDQVPFSKSFGTIVAERAIDLCVLGSIFFLTSLLGGKDFELIWAEMLSKFGGKPATPDSFPWKYLFLGIITVMMAVFGIVYSKNATIREKIRHFVQGVFGGVFSIFKSKNPGAYILHTLIIWSCYLLMFGVCFFALEETVHVPLQGMLIAFIAGSIGITFTNGGIGSYPLLVGLVITFYLQSDYPDRAEGIGNALGMLMWVSQTFMMIGLGLLSLVLLPKNYTSENVEATENSK